MKPIIYLETRALINSIKNIFNSPKRLIPAAIMGAYLVSMILQSVITITSGNGIDLPNLDMLKRIPIDTIETGVFFFLCVGTAAIIYGSFNSGSLVFSISDIDFLFATPLKRKSVLITKLIKDYFKYFIIIFTIAFFLLPVLSRASSAFGISIFPSGIISLLALTALVIFVINVSNVINIVFTFDNDRFKLSQFLIKIAMIAPPVLAIIRFGYKYFNTYDWQTSMVWSLETPYITFIFAPIKWVTSLLLVPLIGMTNQSWLYLAALIVTASISFFVLISRTENFYEPSIGTSLKYASRIRAMRSGDQDALKISSLKEKGIKKADGIKIPEFGRGASALLWKSFIVRYRASKARLISMMVIPVFLVYLAGWAIQDSILMYMMPIVLLEMTGLMSFTIQYSLTGELKFANILKTMPISTWKIIFAKVVDSILYITMGVLIFGLACWILLPGARSDYLIAAVIYCPFMVFCCTSILSTAAMLYSDSRDMIQTTLRNMIGMLLAGLFMLPNILLALVLFWTYKMSVFHGLPIICALSLVLGYLGIIISGDVLDKYDPTDA